MKQWILLGILILVILFLTIRERFEATETIKNPSTWNEAEITRIRNMIVPPLDVPKEKIIKFIGGFWPEWVSANRQITTTVLNNYLNTVSMSPSDRKSLPASDTREVLTAEQRSKYLQVLMKYYIEQGYDVFQKVRNEGREEIVDQSGSYLTSTDPYAGPERGSTVDLSKSPSAQLTYLKQTIATYAGIPVNDDAKLKHYITPIQTFYDTKYLPAKQQPTLDEINAYVSTVDDSAVPAGMKASFKANLTSILDFWFTEPSNVTPSSETSDLLGGTSSGTSGGTSGGASGGTSGGTSGGASSTTVGTTGGSSGVGYGPNSGAFSKGKNIWGPFFAGMGSSLFNGTKSKHTNADYPVLLGGQSSDVSTRIDHVGITKPSGFGLDTVLPPSASLGSDLDSRFLPYARQPGTDTTDPYRLMGKYSTASYSTKPDPIPFLTDFSAFFK